MFKKGDIVVIVASGVQGTVTGVYEDDTFYVQGRGFESRLSRVQLRHATGKIKVRVTQIKKGDRFFNEYWNEEVVATTDAYRLDGRDDDVSGYKPGQKPKQAQCHWDGKEWQRDWWMVEVGVSGLNRGGGGGWTEVEHRFIEVERPEVERSMREQYRAGDDFPARVEG
jgi:hypothetical protein